VLGVVTLVGFLLAAWLWPAHDPEEIEHAHPNLSPDHPHLQEREEVSHAHAFVIDDLHRHWPDQTTTKQSS
jgi:hypothetical protein